MMKKSAILLIITIVFSSGCQTQSDSVSANKITWHESIPKAIQTARAENKPVLIQFGAKWCPYCVKLNNETLSDSTVINRLKEFVAVKIDVDKDSVMADAYQANARKYGGVGIPNVLFLAKDETRLKHIIGFRTSAQFISILDSVLVLAADNP